MRDGFIKVAAGTPRITVADVEANVSAIRSLMSRADENGANLLVLPELCVTGATCADLFFSEMLHRSVNDALAALAEASKGLYPVVVVGTPLQANGFLFNCAAVIHDGKILALVPKTCLANNRHFLPADSNACPFEVTIGGETVPVGRNMIFCCEDMPSFKLGIEIGDDLWAPDPPSRWLCQNNATVIANPAASGEVVGRAEYRRMLVKSTSARLNCGYVQANADKNESTQDGVFSLHNIIAENGEILIENPPFGADDLIFSEIDVRFLESERRKSPYYDADDSMPVVNFHQEIRDTELTRHINCMPFIPESEEAIAHRAEEILRIQSYALKKRVEHTHVKTIVVGISGGLDSCLALLVMARTMDLLGRSRKDIIAVSMPCFGTTSRTRSNAEMMCEYLGVSFREVNISKAVRQHFSDIGHDEAVRDVTYENSQARERTQVIMDISNDTNGLVIGTGDISELALGWATYNGDHMSMYGVNAGLPKTLIRHVVRYEASRSESDLAKVLYDILDTPVSPELLPADSNGEIQQKTEDLVGPYELHDFFLYNAVRYGFSPKKIYRLAQYAFNGAYDNEVILKWLRIFFRRFFMQQFKRSCLPDGPKVGSVSLSPRGDWSMPTDAASTLWLKEIDSLKP